MSAVVRLAIGNAHLQAEGPRSPSITSKMTEASKEPKALLIRLPQMDSDMRKPISLRLYRFEVRRRAPGKKAASANPSKNRATRVPKKLSAGVNDALTRCMEDALCDGACQ